MKKAREQPTITTSVRAVIEYTYAQGDLVPAQLATARAHAGTLGHQAVHQRRPENYQAEVPLKKTFSTDVMTFVIQGRADGIIAEDDPTSPQGQRSYVIDEIKTTTRDLDELSPDFCPMHWYQGQMYGYIFAEQEKLESLTIQLTYYQLRTERTRRFRQTLTFEELHTFFNETVKPFISWHENIFHWEEQRDKSIEELEFPYPTERAGQRELVERVEKAITSKERLFACAPTGIGKTIGVLYPSIKTMAQGHCKKLFFLTARTTGRAIAEKTLDDMRQKGLCLRAVTLTAKEKICAFPHATCHPDSCPNSAGYFNRLKDGLLEALEHQSLTRPTIEKLAAKHQLCPFEYSLDVALFSDVVICDYNYAFDPRVHLRRFFDGKKRGHVILVDEAHNLVDRGRDIYSAELVKGSLVDLKRTLGPTNPLTPYIQTLNKWFIEKGKTLKSENIKQWAQEEKPDTLLEKISEFRQRAEEALINDRHLPFRDELLDLYFQAATFEKTAQRYGQDYVTLIEGSQRNMRARLYCMDPSRQLRNTMDKARSTILFSATLRPLDYYRSLLTGNEDDETLTLVSPFPSYNLCTLVADRISTTYRKRHLSYEHIARSLKAFTDGRRGNYLTFFPSYAYMHEVYERFTFLTPQTQTLLQEKRMSEKEREDFLENFSHDQEETLVGFAVMGGVFGEGIDLVGEKCVGTAVIGVGLPQICLERDLIRQYFDEYKEAGFAYAYQYPGITRVLQAAGRLIRTENDRGVLLLIDERFAWDATKRLLPPEWPSPKPVRTPKAVSEAVKEFWALPED